MKTNFKQIHNNKQAEAKNATRTGQDIDEIRDILFGENLRDTDAHFYAIEKSIKSLKKDFEQKLNQAIDKTHQHFTSELSKLSDEQKTQNMEGLNKLERELQKQLDVINKKFNTNIKALENTITNRVSDLANEKLDRHALAKLFTAIASDLKSNESNADQDQPKD